MSKLHWRGENSVFSRSKTVFFASPVLVSAKVQSTPCDTDQSDVQSPGGASEAADWGRRVTL